MGRDQFGHGGSRKISKSSIKRSQQGGSHKKGCCSYAEAGKAITRLNFKLAVRYVRMDIKARLGVI